MPSVEFHILSEAGDIARLRYACHLIDQAYQQQQRCYVLVSNDEEANRVDETLWTFRDNAFIPHELLCAESPTHSCVMAVIGSSPTVPSEFQASLVNLSGAIPETLANFARVIEIVDADSESKQQARERYKQYRDQGCQLQTKNQ